MSELHINCPHCGSSFQVMVKGEPSSMMVFSCVRCKTPLMYYGGETAELDRDEFAGLRKRLSKVLDVVVSNDASVKEVADSLRRMVDASNALAEERVGQSGGGDGRGVAGDGDARGTAGDRDARRAVAITDEALEKLQKDLAEMDAEKFLESL
jgi:DNA-directed RNA polymerase subunit RPC12/RpoP